MHSAVLRFFLVVLFVLSSTGVGAEQTLQGRVVSVADGDTLTVLLAGNVQERIRLAEIDAPESGQAFGKKSKQSLSEMCAGQQARVEVSGRDRYKRMIGRVFCSGVDTTAEQVRRGMAWVYTAYATDPSLPDLERQAKAAKRGLWNDPQPMPPWEWRSVNRSPTGDRSVATPAGNRQTGSVRGNANSMVYHLPHCPSYDKVSPRNIRGFASEADARAAGYRRAKNCR
jgi:endonuclease YncB( thermonuclease family)